MTPPQHGPTETFGDRVVSILIDSTRRQYVLTLVAYVTGLLGLGMVFAQELWLDVPYEVAAPAAIGLMGISFLSLFVATISGPSSVER
jgi:hypothetical protein